MADNKKLIRNTVPLSSCIGNPNFLPIALIVLGVPGTGKTVVSINLAKLLKINSVINTDFIREVLRFKGEAETDPFLFASSFDAWKVLGDSSEKNIIKGWTFSRQAITGAVQQLMRVEFDRKRDFILEGTLAPRPNTMFSAIGCCVHVLLTLSSKEERLKRLEIKAVESRGKKIDRWFTGLDVTQQIQDYLLLEAKQNNYTIIENTSLDATVDEIINIPIPVPN